MIIGIIGGIGSGKSTVSEYLENKYGFLVFKSDTVAKEIMTADPEVVMELKCAFGDDIYNEDGSVNRQKYASILYSDEKNRVLSNSIIHPACWKEIRKRVSERRWTTGERILILQLKQHFLQTFLFPCVMRSGLYMLTPMKESGGSSEAEDIPESTQILSSEASSHITASWNMPTGLLITAEQNTRPGP